MENEIKASDSAVDLRTKTICVIDNGLFVEIAIKLKESYGRVLYFKPWISGFPSKRSAIVGKGIKEIEVIDNYEDYFDEIDVYCFPDIYFGPLQEHLKALGKPVWGSGMGDEMELKRWETKLMLKDIGLAVQPVKKIIGLEKLREFLKQTTNKWIKIDCYRGDGETWHHEKYSLSEPMLDALEGKLGIMQNDYEFIVEDSIDGEDIVEVGYDGYTVDGKFPTKAIFGYEIKDLGYLGVVKDYSKLSPIITGVNDKLSPVLNEYQYRNFFSTELRVGKDKIPYLIDPCCRAGSPPNEVYQELFANLGEIIWGGAHGILVEPKFKAKFGLEVLIHSDWANENWQAVYFPEEIRQWVKLRNVYKFDETYYVVPQGDGLPEIGAVVAIGNTVEEVVEKIKEYASKIEGFRLDIKIGSIDTAIQETKKGEKLGIKFD